MTIRKIRPRQFAEAVAVAVLLLIQFHFLSERIGRRDLPTGDEGSWMSVAAQLCRGEGFTTRWLEHPFLTPYSLPRPDDYRFPGLTLVLALAFKVFGISYHTALWTVGVIAMLWTMTVFLVCRACFGAKTSLLTMMLMVFSLLQLEWNTLVYTEGLFGLVFALLVACSLKADFQKIRWWAIVGAATGALYLVRPNAILFLFGLAPLALSQRRGGRLPWKAVSASVGVFFAVALPWLVRNAAHFNNPFHFAGSGGMLRLSTNDPLTYSVLDFAKHYGVFQPIGSVFEGFVAFFNDLHFFEHGLEIVPLAFACVALGRSRRFYNGFIAGGIALTFLICCYQEYLSWGGIRYFSPIIPFVYAYGINEMVALFNQHIGRIAAKAMRLRFPLHGIGLILCAFLLLFPVVYPHRFYERKYSAAMPSRFPLADYAAKLSANLPENGSYLSFAMAQLNFQWRYDCVGVQEYFDSSSVPQAMRTFGPTLAAFTGDELALPRIMAIFRALRTNGYAVVATDSVADVTFFAITRANPAAVAAPDRGN